MLSKGVLSPRLFNLIYG
ncbi:TPA: protein YchT [Escherichia coli]|nr:protein YchT [Escherichia coli]